ncbi:MAG: hypothetical protein JWM33_3674 [Caulobacteraceae bacterium]|nr:hypothetical protein [Caulobacteraceae bacterium]
MAEDGEVLEYFISLESETRSDGSVLIRSPDLPLFSVIGENERIAYTLAMELLPEYLRMNVPDFVDLRPVPSATTIFSHRAGNLLPAHIIARAGEQRDRTNKAEAA